MTVNNLSWLRERDRDTHTKRKIKKPMKKTFTYENIVVRELNENVVCGRRNIELYMRRAHRQQIITK